LDINTNISYTDTGAGPGNDTNLSNNDPTTGGLNPSDPNNASGTFTEGGNGVVVQGQSTLSNNALTGPFDLTGKNGSKLILYSSSETGPVGAEIYQAAQATSSGLTNNAGNMAVDIDQAAAAGMSVNDYVHSQISENLFNNVDYAFHQGPATSDNPNGQIDPNLRQVYSGNSGLANVVSQNLAPGGYVVLDGCYGTNFSTGQVNNPAWVQGIANAYGSSETVTSSGTGPVEPNKSGISPTTALFQPEPFKDDIVSRPGSWIVTRPNN
jgi:hypothetical protein